MLIYIIIAILTILNITGFITVAADKHKAGRKLWRIPEKVFFILSFIGACPGVYFGLLLFRHKTRHWYFMLGIPAIFAIQLLLLYFFVRHDLLSVTKPITGFFQQP